MVQECFKWQDFDGRVEAGIQLLPAAVGRTRMKHQ